MLSFFIYYVLHNATLFYPTEDEQSFSLHISAQFLPHDKTVWLQCKNQRV